MFVFFALTANDGVCAVYFMAYYTLLCSRAFFLILKINICTQQKIQNVQILRVKLEPNAKELN
jgi:hypothetical protein